MLLSELIQSLQKNLEKYGNVPVLCDPGIDSPFFPIDKIVYEKVMKIEGEYYNTKYTGEDFTGKRIEEKNVLLLR